MSTDLGSRDNHVEERITLTKEGEWWVATDEHIGIVSQGKSRQDALENLDEAIAGYHGGGEEPTDEQLHEAGIDPEKNVSGEPDVDIFQSD